MTERNWIYHQIKLYSFLDFNLLFIFIVLREDTNMTGFLLKAIVAFATLFALCYATEVSYFLGDKNKNLEQILIFLFSDRN